MELCCNLYNVALQEKIQHYRKGKKKLSCYDQYGEIPELRKSFPEYSSIDVQLLRDVLNRLDRSFEGFFKRLKTGEKSGFPRFRSVDRYRSFTLCQNGWKIEDKKLIVRNLGTFKIILHRPIEGNIKTVTIKRCSDGKWYVTFICDNVSEKRLDVSNKVIGVDMGIKTFCTDSDGNKFDNPLYFKRSEKLLRRRKRSWSRKKKGSNNRLEARLLASKVYNKIVNQRSHFLHQLANYYIKNYGNIYIEDLTIRRLINTTEHKKRSKDIQDSSWGKFFNYLFYKAEDAGREVIKVNPRNTSKKCSNCGWINHNLKLSDRVWTCPVCETIHERDVNGAKNVLWVGQTHQTITKEDTLCVV
jgi:putative transposase